MQSSKSGFYTSKSGDHTRKSSFDTRYTSKSGDGTRKSFDFHGHLNNVLDDFDSDFDSMRRMPSEFMDDTLRSIRSIGTLASEIRNSNGEYSVNTKAVHKHIYDVLDHFDYPQSSSGVPLSEQTTIQRYNTFVK